MKGLLLFLIMLVAALVALAGFGAFVYGLAIALADAWVYVPARFIALGLLAWAVGSIVAVMIFLSGLDPH